MASDSTTPKSAKADLRKTLAARREILPKEDLGKRIHEQLESWAEYRESVCILTYFPFRSELDMFSRMRTSGKAVYLPRMDDSGHMHFHRVEPGSTLIPNQYGIAEPHPNQPLWTGDDGKSLVIVPGLAFDRRGNRLGYGKGFYDRWLTRHHCKVTAVGAVPAALLVKAIPTDPWDYPMDWLVTENERIRCQ